MHSRHATGIVHHCARKYTVTTKGNGNCRFAVAAVARDVILLSCTFKIYCCTF